MEPYKIVPFENKYLSEMVDMYIRFYDPKQVDWDVKSVLAYLKKIVEDNQDFCLEALEGDKCVGAIFVDKGLPCKNKWLLLESIQVLEDHQNKGIGGALLNALVNKARLSGYFGIHFLVDAKKPNLLDWYKKKGAQSTDLVEYAIYINETE